MAINLTRGWTSSSLTAPLASRTPQQIRAPLPAPGPSDVGPVNALAQSPYSAASLMTRPTDATDPALGSRLFQNPLTGYRDVAAQQSVYAQPQAPAFLQNAIAGLNAEQSMARSAQAELLDRLTRGASGQTARGMEGTQMDQDNAYLWQEALRAASVSPGAHVNFGAAVTDPRQGISAITSANALAAKAAQQTAAIRAANAIPIQIAALQKKKMDLGPAPGGFYSGSRQQALDRQLFALEDMGQASSGVQRLGQSAARSSGWATTPTLPYY